MPSECRINVENPILNFQPSPGRSPLGIHAKRVWVRVDTHAHAMYRVPPYYDSMIAKVIVRAKSRKEAISRMKRALNEFVVEGIHTTIPLHLAILENEEFASGAMTRVL